MDAVDTGQFFFDDLADQRIAVDGKDDFRIGDFFDDAAQGLIDVAHRFAQVFPAVRRQEDDPVVLEVDGFQVVAEVIVAGEVVIKASMTVFPSHRYEKGSRFP